MRLTRPFTCLGVCELPIVCVVHTFHTVKELVGVQGVAFLPPAQRPPVSFRELIYGHAHDQPGQPGTVAGEDVAEIMDAEIDPGVSDGDDERGGAHKEAPSGARKALAEPEGQESIDDEQSPSRGRSGKRSRNRSGIRLRRRGGGRWNTSFSTLSSSTPPPQVTVSMVRRRQSRRIISAIAATISRPNNSSEPR